MPVTVPRPRGEDQPATPPDRTPKPSSPKPTRIRLRGIGPEAQVSFPAEVRALVRGMADDLKGSPVVGEQRLVGFVSHFGRGEEDELGRVTLRAMLGGSERSIRLFLSDEQYHTAGEANLNRRTVYVRGNMERTSGRTWEFKDVQDFGIVAGLPIE